MGNRHVFLPIRKIVKNARIHFQEIAERTKNKESVNAPKSFTHFQKENFQIIYLARKICARFPIKASAYFHLSNPKIS